LLLGDTHNLSVWQTEFWSLAQRSSTQAFYERLVLLSTFYYRSEVKNRKKRGWSQMPLFDLFGNNRGIYWPTLFMLGANSSLFFGILNFERNSYACLQFG
jgi:hypothetical protein